MLHVDYIGAPMARQSVIGPFSRHRRLFIYFVIGALMNVSVGPIPGYASLGFAALVAMQLMVKNGMTTARTYGAVISLVVSAIFYAFVVASHGHTPWTRQFMALIFFISIILLLARVTDSSGFSIIAVLGGYCLGWLGSVLVNPTGLAATDWANAWKFGVAVPSTIVVLILLLCFRKGTSVAAATLILLGIGSLFLNFRSHGAICLIAAAIILSSMLPQMLRLSRSLTIITRIGVVGICMVPIGLLPALVARGVFGSDVQQKSLLQSELGPWYLAGRTEPAMSVAIIQEHPFIGWGSTSEIPISTVRIGAGYLSELGLANVSLILNGWYRHGGEPTLHSILAQYWVEAGVLSVFGFFAIAFYSVICIRQTSDVFWPLYLYLFMQFFWDLLFSPYTDQLIGLWGIVFAIFVWVGGHRKKVQYRQEEVLW